MHTFINIKWRVSATVVGATFLALLASILINRLLASTYIMDKRTELFQDTVIIEAEGYSMAFVETVSMMMRAQLLGRNHVVFWGHIMTEDVLRFPVRHIDDKNDGKVDAAFVIINYK